MTPISNTTVMHQVKTNLVYELLDLASRDPRRQIDLFQFLAFERVPVTADIYARLMNLPEPVYVIGKTTKFFINDYHPKPQRTGWGRTAIKKYTKQMILYLAAKILVPILKRSLVLHEDLSVWQMHPMANKNSGAVMRPPPQIRDHK